MAETVIELHAAIIKQRFEWGQKHANNYEGIPHDHCLNEKSLEEKSDAVTKDILH